MTTVINNPGTGDGSDNSAAIIIGIIVLVIAVALFVMYGLPMMQNSETPSDGSIDVNVTLPAGGTDTAPAAGN